MEQFCSRNKALIAEGLAKSKSCLWIFVVVFVVAIAKRIFRSPKNKWCVISLYYPVPTNKIYKFIFDTFRDHSM